MLLCLRLTLVMFLTAAGSLSAAVPHLNLNQQSGTMLLQTDAVSTEIHGLWFDGEFQKDFESAGANHYRNSSLDLTIETLSPYAVAATWAARDLRPHEFRLRIKSDDETEYYGTGERFQALNQRGYILPIRGDDRFGNKGVGSHKPVPFFISSKGFGIWVDTLAPGTFDLGGTERFNTDLQFRDTSLRVVFIGGPSMANVLEHWTALTGRSPVPPAWAFGLWKSRDVHRNRQDVLEDVENLRRLGIPASVLVFDSPWESGYNDFELNRQQFTDAEAMLRRIDNLGFYLALWLTPFVNSKSRIDMQGIAERTSTFDEAMPYLVHDARGNVMLTEWWKGVGGLVDFTDPQAKQWWFTQLRKTKRYGAHAFKCDDGEGNFVPDALFADGSPPYKMKNRYSILYDAAMQEYIDRELGGDGVLIVRSGTTGMQRYPMAWAGDNHADFSFSDGLPSVILAGQNAAMSGISLWGSDIAGYAGKQDKELFIRWSQFAAFCPFMQIHMMSNLGPWDFDEEALEIFRRLAVLRMQLFPYLYDAVHETSRSGMPVIRPMALAFPDDVEAHKQIYQFLFGPDVLVAPMYQRGVRRTVYLPKGTWFDYWTGAKQSGPRTVDVDVPLGRVPLFVREGAIIPMLPQDVMTLVPHHAGMDANVKSIDDRRIIQIFPGVSGELKTWDGISVTLEKGEVRISSKTPRPVEVRAFNTTLAKIERLEGERVIPLGQ